MEPVIYAISTGNVYETIIATKALVVNNEIIGVAAVEFMMNYQESAFYYDFNAVAFETSGFSAVLSADGLVLSNPPTWNSGNLIYRVYDDDVTGISFSKWQDIRDELNDEDSNWTFTTNEVTYTLYRSFVKYKDEPILIIIA